MHKTTREEIAKRMTEEVEKLEDHQKEAFAGYRSLIYEMSQRLPGANITGFRNEIKRVISKYAGNLSFAHVSVLFAGIIGEFVGKLENEGMIPADDPRLTDMEEQIGMIFEAGVWTTRRTTKLEKAVKDESRIIH